MARQVQRRMTFTKSLLPSSIMTPSSIIGEDFIEHKESSRESISFLSQEFLKISTKF